MIYLLTAIGLTPGGSSTVHIYTQTIRRTTKNKHYIEQHKKQYIEQHKKYIQQHKNKLEQCGPCPVLVSYTLAFALQLRKK
jgi:predicted PP-loop superfamily ATPase